MKHANIAIFVPHVGCPNRCSFCDQQRITGVQAPPDGGAVRAACEQALQQMGEEWARNTEVAFFGGSFTAIPREYMIELLEAASPFVGEHAFHGIRISTRPDAIDPEVLGLLRVYGVTAIELGAQSMDDEVLRLNRRGHTARDVENASRMIRAGGFSLGHQMMFGLYGDTAEKTIATARRLAALQPDTMRVYPTVVLKNTMLAELYEQGRYRPLTVPEAVRMSAWLLDYFETHGVSVIRLGLHASRELEENMIAGGYHAALGELCANELFRQRILRELEQCNPPLGKLVVEVAPGRVSQAVGQRRSNALMLEQRGYQPKFCPNRSLTGYQCRFRWPLSKQRK